MRKILLLKDINGGAQKTGWCVELSDATAQELVNNGTAKFMPADAPLKKGNLELYDGCTPIPAKFASAKAKQANTNTIKE